MSRRPIVLVTHSYFDEDPRLRREADALLASNRDVDVLALRRPGEPPLGVVGGAHVHRLDVSRHQGAGIRTYLGEYVGFFARAAAQLARDQRRRRYALAQIATLPDWLVFAGLPLRLTGVPLVIDLHEAMPEFFASRFPRASGGAVQATLMATERASIAAATHAIAANAALRDRLIRLGVQPARISVVPNVPSLARFNPARQPARAFMADGILRLVYAGALSPIYEVDVAIAAVARLRESRPGLPLRFEIYGRDFGERPLPGLVREAGLEDVVTFHGRIPIEDVPAAIAAADIGLSPTARSQFTDLSVSTKILEYGAMGKAVVASRLPTVMDTFRANELVTYEPGDAASLSAAVLHVVDEPHERQVRIQAMLGRADELSWEREAPRYTELIDRFARPD
ncbi:MAG TPA: glycosyltransferase [Candidatus Limnocylindrales bacterium]|nr:glycosyltransferase [Candidatus Limnocylindrales bacterium]